MKYFVFFLGILVFINMNKFVYAGGGDILYTKPVKSVVFSHKAHSKIHCDKCHSGLFEMKALAAQEKTDFDMNSLYKGKYCGACHNGKYAFASDKQCARCHGGVKEYTEYKRKPTQRLELKGPATVITIGTGSTKVDFSHTKHDKLSCGECHSKLFKMKKGVVRVTFSEHHNNIGCFACHNGKSSFGINNCTSCHNKKPYPKSKLVYTFKDGIPSAYFSHEFHTKIFKCEDCHNKLFEMRMGGSNMNMSKMYEGKYCGACHNGMMASDVKDCTKCHIIKK